MLPLDLIYEISTFLSPKAIIKLSLCSKELRVYVLNSSRIWRTQYYKEWPAFFTTHSSADDVFFPAPTWIQTFLMRKLSEANIEKRIMKEIHSDVNYVIFQDLMLHLDRVENRLTIYKGLGQKIAEYVTEDVFSIDYAKILCGNFFFVSSGFLPTYLHCFSLEGEYKKIETAFFRSFFPVDEKRFLGTFYRDASIVTVNSESGIEEGKLDFLEDRIITQVHGKPGWIVAIDEMSNRKLTWALWNIRSIPPQIVMEREFIPEDALTKVSQYFLAGTRFLFIPFKTKTQVFVYVYSFLEDKSRIFKVCDMRYEVEMIILYNQAQSALDSCKAHFNDARVIFIHFSGTELEHFTFSVFDASLINFYHSFRNLVLIASYTICKLVNVCSGAVIWQENIEDDQPYKIDMNSRYLIINKRIYDFSSEKCLELNDWFYKNFE